MKNQTITTSLNFTSDVSDAISGLKKLREQMGNLTTDQSIFGNVDKEFEKVQKAMRDLAAKKEFTGTSKGAAEYKKILDSITVSANKIGQELTQIGTNANGAFKFKNVEQAQRVLAGLESNLKLVNKGLKDAQKELSTGLKNLGINEITAKTLQGEQAVTEELRKQYELRKQNYENLVASQRAGIASKLSNSVRKINTTSIVDPGTDKFKGTAADTVQASIQTALAEGIKQSQTWEQVQSKILEDLNRSQIVVQNIDKLLEPIKNDFQEAALKAGSEADNVKKAREEMEALGRIGENGVFQFSQGAQSAINLANSVDKAKQSQVNLKGQVDAAKQSIQQEGQIGQQSLNQITAGTEQAVQQTKNFVNAEHQATDSINEQNKEQEKLDKSMSKMQGWIVNILSIGNAWRKFTQIIRQTFNDAQKLDKAFASIAMVTDKTVEGLWSTYDQYADMANRLGQSTESAIKASALFYQQGLDTADALRLTEDTMKLATLAGADFETATQQMTAALRGFHMEMDEGAHVTDVYSELAAHAAADVNGIAYAMSKTASIASSAGMDFETTAAFLTNMIETTQEAPENIGTAMKTIIARFTELKENVSAADSEFDDLDYNKVDKALKSVGIQLKDTNGQFRNLDDVFLELSSKWDTLDRNTQRYIATIAAGSRQQSRFIAMMEDYDRTMQLVETAQDSAGRSSEQFAKYQDTVEYKLNQLKNAWEQLRVTMVDSDIFKGAIDSLTTFVKGLSKIDFKKLIVFTPIVVPLVKNFIKIFMDGMSNSAQVFQQAGQKISQNILLGMGKVSNKFFKADKLQSQLINIQAEQKAVKHIENNLQELKTKKQQISNTRVINEAEVQKATSELARLTQEMNELAAGPRTNESRVRTEELIGEIKIAEQELEKTKNTLSQVSAEESKYAEKTKGASAALDEKTKKLNADTEAYQRNAQKIQAASQGMTQGFQTVGSAAVTAFAAMVSGADITATLKTLFVSLAMQLTQMGIQLAAQLVAAQMSAKTRVALEAKTQTEITAAQAAGSAARVTMAGAEGFAEGAALGNGINAGLISTGVGAIIVGIALGITAIGLGIAALVKKYKAEHQSIEEQISNSQKKIEELEKLKNEADSSYNETKENIESARQLKDEFTELQKKVVKTTEEQEKYNSLVDQIKEQYPEIISKYDEVTGQLTVQNELWEGILEKQERSLELEGNKKYQSNMSYLEEQKNLLELQNKQAEQRYSNQQLGNSNWTYRYFGEINEGSKTFGQGLYSTSKNYGIQEKFIDDIQKSLTDTETEFAKVLGLSLSSGEDLGQLGGALYYGLDAELEDYEKVFGEEAEQKYQYLQDYKDLIELEYKNQKEQYEKNKELYIAQQAGILSQQLENKGYSSAVASFAAKRGAERYTQAAESKANLAIQENAIDIGEKTKFEDLPTEMKKAFKEIQVDSQETFEQWKEGLGETAGIGKETFNVLKDYYLEQFTAAYADNLTDDQKNIVESMPETLQAKSVEELEAYKKYLAALYKDTAPAFYGQLEKDIEDRKKVIEDKIKKIAQSSGINESYFKGWKEATLDAYTENIQKITDTIGAESAQEYAQSLRNIFDEAKLNAEQINNVFNVFDWSQITMLNYDEYKQKFLDMCEELGIDGGEKLYEQLANQNVKFDLTDMITVDEEKLTEFFDDLKKKADDIWKEEDTIVQTIAAASVEGSILDLDTYEKLDEYLTSIGESAEDYVQVMEDGSIVVTNAEGLRQVYEDQLNVIHEEIEAKKASLRVTIQEIKAQHDLLIEEKKQTLERWKQRGVSGQDLGRLSDEIYKLEHDDTINKIAKYEDMIAELDKQDKKYINLAKARNAQFQKDTTEAIEKVKEEAEKATEGTGKEVDDLAKKAEEATDKVADAWEKVADAQEKVNEALEKIKEKEQDVIDKTDELNKILYGDQYHKNKLDAMYNYSTALDAITAKTSRAKRSLESYNGKEDVSALMQTYMQGTHAEVVNRSAQNEVIAASIRNYEQVLSSKLASEISSMNAAHGSHMSTNISDYVYKNGNVTAVNFQALNAAQLPDEISDYVEECVEIINNLQKQIDDNTEAIKQKEKEIRDMRKNAFQRRVNLEKEVADVLKKQAEDEVKTQKDKYDALKDADNDYLDALEQAINKERELRERNKEWDDLATKEKKLSLMQRDTSGANAKEVMSLEQDVQDTRENLLDKTIDDIIKGMKEMYELQQESREKELEYQEAMMESTEWIKQATAIIDGWTTSDDMVTWFIENATEEYTNGSAVVQESMRMSWEDTGNQMVADSEILSQDMSDLAIATHEEISQTVIETSETLTEQADFSLQSIVTSAEDAIAKGEQALEDAIKEVQNARDDYREAIKELEEAEAAARQAENDARKAQQEYDQKINETPSGGNGGSTSSWNIMPAAIGGTQSSSTRTHSHSASYWNNLYDSQTDYHAKDDIARQASADGYDPVTNNGNANFIARYKEGGLVDYTGPAWVDGTLDEPESFLSAEDTKRIGAAAELLASLPFFNGGSINNSVNNGDSLIQVHINIENISSDVDLDNALDKMKNAIWEAANPAGSSVILSK